MEGGGGGGRRRREETINKDEKSKRGCTGVGTCAQHAHYTAQTCAHYAE